jgi:hypothetical protein
MKSTNEPRVIVKLGGITPEQARDVRARTWRFVFDCYAKKKAVTSEEKASVSTGRRGREEGDS